ncbi:nuclear transport factor 2 family protein [Streptomyces albidochromogenes]|uniref:nuclear transport factor 2 family protein n=1 Tax=Streptomyces albidochromogenes TaxID=329524 RepID=UPI00110FE49F|nr:nuclear transport factor 2 family protein [Streptomyces albidochromogenes]
MTQREELATVLDRLAVDAVVTGYAIAVDDADWAGYRALFTPGGRADYRTAGGIEGPAAEVADWLARTMRRFPVRQHLIVNRRLRLDHLGGGAGDRAALRADYVNPMVFESAPEGPRGDDVPRRPAEPNFTTGGRYAFGLIRTEDGWRISSVVVQEKWRRTTL